MRVSPRNSAAAIHRAPAGRIAKAAAALAVVALLFVAAAPARAEGHDPQRAGHPLRILAYALHPVGYILDTVIFRPADWLVHHEPFTTIFGADRDDDY